MKLNMSYKASKRLTITFETFDPPSTNITENHKQKTSDTKTPLHLLSMQTKTYFVIHKMATCHYYSSQYADIACVPNKKKKHVR